MAATDITFRLKRGTAANLTALANSALLNAGEPYYITDQNRIAIGVTPSSFETFAKVSELSSAGGGMKFTENETAPTSPSLGDMWLVPSTGTWYQRVTNTGGSQVWVEINTASGTGSGNGFTTINFGNHPGSNEASVVVTGLTNIGTNMVPRVGFYFGALGNKTANDHRYASLLVNLMVGPVTSGSGFTIYATSLEKMTGSFTLNYSWN